MNRKTAITMVIMGCIIIGGLLTAGCTNPATNATTTTGTNPPQTQTQNPGISPVITPIPTENPPVSGECVPVNIKEKTTAVDGNYYAMGDNGVAYRVLNQAVYDDIVPYKTNSVKLQRVGSFQRIGEVCS